MAFTIQNASEATHLALTRISRTDIDILVAALSGDALVLSGCAVTAQGTPNGTVAVAAGEVGSGEAVVAVTGGDVNVLSGAGSTTAHATLERIDVITADLTTGALAVTAGTAAAASAVLPPSIPAGTVVLAFVYVPATYTTIASTAIADKRVDSTPASSVAARVVKSVNFR